MKKLLAALACLLAFSAPSYAQQSKAALVSEVNVNWPDNTTGLITPALLRSTVIDIINSYLDRFGALSFLYFSTGYITSVASATGVAGFSKVSTQSTIDNMTASSGTAYSCTVSPTVFLLECGTSNSCATPVTMASVTVTGASTAFTAATITPTITAGDFVAWTVRGGTCTSINLRGAAQFHQN